MASVNITHKFSAGRLERVLRGQGLRQNMSIRGAAVANQAKRNLSRPPQRVDTGRLRGSIKWRVITIAGGYPGVRVWTDVHYARYVHDGTGLYGPKGQWIYPKRARFLRFQPKGSAGYVYARRVRGMRPNNFLADALSAGKL